MISFEKNDVRNDKKRQQNDENDEFLQKGCRFFVVVLTQALTSSGPNFTCFYG